MNSRALLAVAPVVVFVALLAAACGSGSSDDDATTAAGTTAAAVTTEAATSAPETEAGGETVAAENWAASVCGAITDWQNALTASPPNVTDVTDPAAAKDEIAGYLDGVISATGTLVSTVQGAGVPDVDQGDAIAADLQGAFQSVQQSFEQAKTQVEGLTTDDPNGFAAGLQEIGTTLTQAGDDAGTAISSLPATYPDSGIDEAFTNAPECASITS